MRLLELFTEDNKLSTARISFWFAFGVAMYCWIFTTGFPPSLFEFLMLTLAYSMGKHGLNAYTRIQELKTGCTSVKEKVE